ncbi:MAG: ATP-binding protein [bacterium]
MKKRSLIENIQELAIKNQKMAFISGPRQVGKTTLSKQIVGKSGIYNNWDDIDFRRLWTKHPNQTLPDKDGIGVIYDEIHKTNRWKSTLKGIYDTKKIDCPIIVTGSAKLDIYRKGSDSLMGRYFNFRLHPFSVGEITHKKIPSPDNIIDQALALQHSKAANEAWNNLNRFGGFPEPFLKQSDKFYNIWRQGRLAKVVREDLRDLSNIPELAKIDMLISIMPERVASPVSITSLREDLEVSYDAMKRWLQYLRQLYYHFELKPWSQKIPRSLKKESKLYLWDWAECTDVGAKLENIVASHLLKACHYWTDSGEGNFDLFYLKDKQKHEVDFLITKNNKPFLPIECKLNSTTLSPNLISFNKHLKLPNLVQLVNKDSVKSSTKIDGSRYSVISANHFFRVLP